MPIAAILLVAFVLRGVCIVFYTGTIDSEGAEYARIAENLLAGAGYVGIATPGKQLFLPPLPPFLIAAISLLTHQTELAGRLVSLTMGTLLVLPVYFIARRFYGRVAAYIAATVIALHPLLINYSATVYCEPTFLTLLVTAVYWSIRGLSETTRTTYMLAGIFFGLAYLTRPEAAILTFLAFGWTLTYFGLTRRNELRQIAVRSILLPATFLVVAAPYVLYLHAETGQWRLEGKSPLNYTMGRQMLAGASEVEAAFRVGPALDEQGVWNKPNISTIHSAEFKLDEFASYLIARLKDAIAHTKDEIASGSAIGSPLLFALAVLGLFRKPWHRELFASQLFILIVLANSAAITLFIWYWANRFFLVFVPFLVIWASVGILHIARWASSTGQLIYERDINRPRIELPVVVLLIAGIAIVSLTSVIQISELQKFGRISRPVKTAGEWLKVHPEGPKTVIDTSTILAFHAGASFVWLPYSSSDVALRYLDKRKVDFIVLRDEYLSTRPYLKDWMENGIPSPRAKLIFSASTPELGRIVIYEWTRER